MTASAVLIGLYLCACEHQPEAIVFTGVTMGTDYRITVVPHRAEGSKVAGKRKDQLESAIIDAMESVNQSMSTYLPDSELSRFNRLPAKQTVELSDDTYVVIKKALELSAFTDGAFDVTLGKAIRLWGFAEDGRITEQPSDAVLAEVRQTVGYQKLLLNKQQLSKTVDGLEINLSAIAKGYAVDKVADVLSAQGFKHYLVNIGGELKAAGVKADGTSWRLGIEKPHITGGIEQVVTLHDQAIATSGDYRNYHVIDGQQFSHTIDPKTLKPVYHKLASVSVLADKASTADALATALLSMGQERALKFTEQHNLAAYFIIREQNSDDYRTHATGLFKTNLAK